MKNLSALLIGMLLPVFVIAQQMEGEIIFNEKIKLDIQLPEGQEDMAAMFPSEQNFKKMLLFSTTQSLFMNYEEPKDEENVIEAGNDEVQIKIVMGGADNKLFKDLGEKQSIRKEDFFGRIFLVTGDLESYQWKLTGEQKKILDFNCWQAIHTDEESTTMVWFTAEIPVSNGPDKFGQLPGMILAVDIDNGQRQFIAEKVTFKKLDKDAIKAPKKGKKITADEFEKVVEKKMKEMEEEMGGSGGGIKITID